MSSGKFSSDIDEARLRSQVAAAEAASHLTQNTIFKCAWPDVVKHVNLLAKKDIELPTLTMRLVTRRWCIDLFREAKFSEWVQCLWPPARSRGKAADKRIDGGSDDQGEGEIGFEDIADVDDVESSDGDKGMTWDIESPMMKAVPLDPDAVEEDSQNLENELRHCIFHDAFYNAFKTAKPGKLRPILSAFFEHLELNPLSPQALELTSPLIGFLRCMVSLVFPAPGMYGATPEDVARIMQPSKKHKKKDESPLLSDPLATPFVDALRTLPEWQELHTTYIGWMGAEAAHGPALRDLHVKLKTSFVALQEADKSDDPEECVLRKAQQGIKDNLEGFVTHIGGFRAKLRTGATELVDTTARHICSHLLARFKKEEVEEGGAEILQNIINISKLVGDDATHIEAYEISLKRQHASTLATLAECLKYDVRERPSVEKLLVSLRDAKNKKKDATMNAAMAEQLKSLLLALPHVAASAGVNTAFLAPWKDALHEVLNDSEAELSQHMRQPGTAIKVVVVSCLQVAGDIVGMRETVKAYADARASDKDVARRELQSLKAKVAVVQKHILNPVAVGIDFAKPIVDELIALATMLVDGCDQNGTIGLTTILERAAREMFDLTLDGVSQLLADLEKINGSHPTNEGALWHEGLSADAAYADVLAQAKKTLMKSDGRAIDLLAERLKQACHVFRSWVPSLRPCMRGAINTASGFPNGCVVQKTWVSIARRGFCKVPRASCFRLGTWVLYG